MQQVRYVCQLRLRQLLRLVVMLIFVLVLMWVLVFVRMSVPKMNVEFDTFDLKAFGAMGVEVIIVQRKLAQFLLELMEIDPKVNHGANKHVAAQAAENIKIKCVQCQFDYDRGLNRYFGKASKKLSGSVGALRRPDAAARRPYLGFGQKLERLPKKNSENPSALSPSPCLRRILFFGNSLF